MIVTPCPPIDFTLIDDPSRPKGLHVSRIINSIMQKMEPKRYRKDQTPAEVASGHAKMQMGLAIEAMLEAGFVKYCFPHVLRPGPIKHEGIWMTPDGLDDQEWAIHEYKLTWYSAATKECPTDHVYLPWIWQILAYCRAFDTLVGYLTVCHVCGVYPAGKPTPLPPVTYRLEFTPLERAENWVMLKNEAIGNGWLPPDHG
jgi:hypothetical protein